MTVYVLVSRDQYELPLLVTDTQEEMARILGVRANSIATHIYKHRKGLIKRSHFLSVKIDDDDDNDSGKVAIAN